MSTSTRCARTSKGRDDGEMARVSEQREKLCRHFEDELEEEGRLKMKNFLNE